MTLAEKFDRIGISKNYSDLEFSSLSPDLQGWGSHNPIFQKAIEACRPKIIVEVGTWKGASLVNMAQITKSLGLDASFICVDTWLGSNDTLWIIEEFRRSLRLRGGYPNMFPQFIANLHYAGIQDRVYPLPMTSTCAYHLLKRLEITPDLVYVDAGHEEDEVYVDLKYYYDLLRPGGVLFGDDYEMAWPGVVSAVNRFSTENKLLMMCGDKKFMLTKPY